MSETATQTWSRPALQRTELGPMLHDFAHHVYEEVDYQMAEDQTDRQDIQTMRDVSVLCREVAGRIIGLCDRGNPRFQNLTSYIADHQQDLMTVSSITAVTEGVVSGVIVPAQLFRVINLFETQGNIVIDDLPVGYKHEVDANTVAEGVVSDTFLEMLHQLSYAPNGFLGPQSTSPNGLRDGHFFDCFNGHEVRWGERMQTTHWQDIFRLNDTGQVVGFSRAFLDKKRFELQENNQHHERRTQTGGCPVRHDSFPVITQAANDYLHGERPWREGTSAITRAAQLLSNAVSIGFKEPEDEL